MKPKGLHHTAAERDDNKTQPKTPDSLRQGASQAAGWPPSSSEVMAASGRVGFEAVAWFNGGLFDDGAALPLEAADLETVLAASNLDWSENRSVDPWYVVRARARPR